MNRLTKILDNMTYVVDETSVKKNESGYSGDAINKLGKFEDVYEDLLRKQELISKEMDKLRSEGKNNSVKFKQLLVNKLTNKNIIAIFEVNGL